MKSTVEKLTREDFMAFFRSDEKLDLLTPDDRAEIFSQILLGSSDFTEDSLNSIFNDYSVSNLEIINKDND